MTSPCCSRYNVGGTMSFLVLISQILFAFYFCAGCEALFWHHKPKLIDEWPGSYGSIEKLAKIVCEHQKDEKLIGRVSSIRKLAQYFDKDLSHSTIKRSSSIIECKTTYGSAISSLGQLVDLSNDNVCSEEKISAIEEFHLRFVRAENVDSLMTSGQAPRMLINFFSHYVAQISRMCKESIVPTLEQDVKEKFSKNSDYSLGEDELEEDDSGTVDFTAKLTHIVGNFFNAVHHYEDVLLIWDIVDDQSEKTSSHTTTVQGNHQSISTSNDKSMLVDTIDEVTGEQVRLLVVAKNIRQMLMAQEKCRKRFRPIYSKVILPTARLANLGYSYTDYLIETDEAKLLADNKLVELWYRLTQFCESILPIQFLQDEKLDEKGTAIISLSERDKYLDATNSVRSNLPPVELLIYESPKGLNTLPEDEDKLRTMTAIDGDLEVRKVDSSATARSRNIRTFIARSIRGLKRVYTGNLHFSRQVAQSLGVNGNTGNQQVLDGEFVLADIKGLLSKSSTRNELQKLEQNGDNRVGAGRREKRDVVLSILTWVYVLLLLALIVVLILPFFLIPAGAMG